MLLGHHLPAPYSEWRVVEGDLHDIHSRVREYDAEALLVRNSDSGQLGLAVWHKTHSIAGGAYSLARELFDLTTDQPLMGEPDGRVLRCQRSYDSRRIKDMNAWRRQLTDAMYRREGRKRAESIEGFGDHSERFVHAYGKDIGSTKRAFFRDTERAAA